MIEAIVATVVLAIGLTGMLMMLVAANHSTATNRERQDSTSLAREVIENIRSLGYDQIVTSSLASTLQPLIPQSTVSGTSLTVTRSIYTFTVSLSECSLDDPADGYGNHNNPPESGGSWCPDVAANGTTDTNPDDYKRVSVTVTPSTGNKQVIANSSIQMTILDYAQDENGPAVSCLSTTTSCPGSNVTETSGSSLTFTLTTTSEAASVQWLVNGSEPPASEMTTGSDPLTPTSKTVTFTWYYPTADGTYTISAIAYDGNGNAGTQSSLQITLNRHQAIAPTSITAGWNAELNGGLGGVDVQWVPSVDQDIKYYDVYRYYGSASGSASIVCSDVTGTSCYDLTATSPLPATEPSTCATTSTTYAATSTNYYVVGVDTNPSTGLPRISTAESPTVNADYCNHPPNAPTGLTATASGGDVVLNWTMPSPQDPDSWDSIYEWRIYRWAPGSSWSDPGGRYDLVGTTSSSGGTVTSYDDTSPDPGGVSQDYCVTSVDTHLDESSCSNTALG